MDTVVVVAMAEVQYNDFFLSFFFTKAGVMETGKRVLSKYGEESGTYTTFLCSNY